MEYGVAIGLKRAAGQLSDQIFVLYSPLSALFNDGFESGDPSAWSATSP